MPHLIDPSRPALERPLVQLPCLLSDPKRQNHHLCATGSRLGSTRLARPGRGAVWNSPSEGNAKDRPDPDHDPGPGLAFISCARPDLALDERASPPARGNLWALAGSCKSSGSLEGTGPGPQGHHNQPPPLLHSLLCRMQSISWNLAG